MIVKDVKTSELKPYGNNNRKHPKEQVDKLAKQIEAHGWDVPIVVDKDMCIIKGHARLKAAKKLKLKTVPVIVRDDLTPEQCAAARLADNKLSELAEIDMSAIQTELDALKAINFDLDLTAFDSWNPFAVDAEEGTEGLTDPDDVPELKPDPKSKFGDVWMLGNHRVMCGDSTDAGSVAILMNGQKAKVCLTDPPYGVKRDKGFGGFCGFGGFGPPIKRREYQDNWDSEIPPKECFELLLSHCDLAIIFGGNFFAHILPQSKHWIVWDKMQTMPTFGDCELAWTNSDRTSVKKYTLQYNGLIGKEKERFHPTQKPVKLFESIISDYSEMSELINDLFLGSGSTLIACEKTGRHCYGMELSPQYVDVIIKRWQDFTGKKAIREDGVEFDHC
jgi:DNA modification methylase